MLDQIVEIFNTLRKDLAYSLAVQDLTTMTLDDEQSAAFLLFTVRSCLGISQYTDITLASFGLLKDYRNIQNIEIRRRMLKNELRYEGKAASLYQIEKNCYNRLAKYFLPFYQNEKACSRLLARALYSDCYDRDTGYAILPRYCHKLYRFRIDKDWIDDMDLDSSKNKGLICTFLGPKVIKEFGFTPQQLRFLDSAFMYLASPNFIIEMEEKKEEIENGSLDGTEGFYW